MLQDGNEAMCRVGSGALCYCTKSGQQDGFAVCADSRRFSSIAGTVRVPVALQGRRTYEAAGCRAVSGEETGRYA